MLEMSRVLVGTFLRDDSTLHSSDEQVQFASGQAAYMFNVFLLPKLELALRYVSGVH
jgi:hypothetical protein